jgi:hypothetical protein
MPPSIPSPMNGGGGGGIFDLKLKNKFRKFLCD